MYSHCEMINEAFPPRRPFQEVVDLALDGHLEVGFPSRPEAGQNIGTIDQPGRGVGVWGPADRRGAAIAPPRVIRRCGISDGRCDGQSTYGSGTADGGDTPRRVVVFDDVDAETDQVWSRLLLT